MDSPTRELTAAIVSGDSEAFSRFYDDWFDAMFAIATSSTHRDESFCLDVVQDAMLKVIRRMPVIETEEGLRAWLRRTVLTTAYDRIRSESRRRKHEAAAQRAEVPETSEPVDAAVLDRLRAELESLDPLLVRMLHSRHALGWTLARVGRAMGLSASAADGRLTRAARAIASRLSEVPHE